jgi:hypothetical protein
MLHAGVITDFTHRLEVHEMKLGHRDEEVFFAHESDPALEGSIGTGMGPSIGNGAVGHYVH